MAQTQDPVEVSPQQVKNARTMWERFMIFTKWAVIAIAVLLIGMAATLL